MPAFRSENHHDDLPKVDFNGTAQGLVGTSSINASLFVLPLRGDEHSHSSVYLARSNTEYNRPNQLQAFLSQTSQFVLENEKGNSNETRKKKSL